MAEGTGLRALARGGALLASLAVARWVLRRRDGRAGGGGDGRTRRAEAGQQRPGASLVVVGLAGAAVVGALGLSLLLAPVGFVRDLDEALPSRAAALRVVAGDAEAGREAILAYGCRACHAVPGLPDRTGVHVGPSLERMEDRLYLGGVLPNSPDAAVAWIMDPPRYAPNTAMPDMGIDGKTARDIAAYLYSE